MEVKLIPIGRERLKELITFSFEGDNNLLDSYHISPGSLEHCVNNTFTFIDKNKDFYSSDIHFYSVTMVDEGGPLDLGYTVTITNETQPNELYSFGLRKEYRTEEIKDAWLNAVESAIGLPYYMILWDKNTRAIDFFKKNGFFIEERNDLRKLTNDAPETKDKTLIVKT